jgi:2-polyprenyl-3-methyl-5-hydroxy-6-metoxy-1,4-benzoquinol methylase
MSTQNSADVGCGRGRAIIKLAQTFPDSAYVGYDAVESNVEQARKNAEAAGVTDRVRFEVLDAAKGLPERYDVITTSDVVHDAVDPLALLRSIHDTLRSLASSISRCLCHLGSSHQAA